MGFLLMNVGGQLVVCVNYWFAKHGFWADCDLKITDRDAIRLCCCKPDAYTRHQVNSRIHIHCSEIIESVPFQCCSFAILLYFMKVEVNNLRRCLDAFEPKILIFCYMES